MKKNSLSKNGKIKTASSQSGSTPWKYCFLTVACALILAAGFFFAARQHFSAIEYGIKNAKLRQQKDEMENLQRQLYLAKETAMSPGEIGKAAKKIGLQDFASKGIEVVRAKVESAATAAKKIVDQNLTSSFAAKSSLAGPDKSANEKDSKDGRDIKPKAAFNGDNIRPRVVGK